MIDQLCSEGPIISPERLIDRCLDLLGTYELPEETRSLLVAQAQKGGTLQTRVEDFPGRAAQVLMLIVSTQEYQFA